MNGQSGSRARAIILMYHRVATLDRDEWGLCISPDSFRQHMRAIRQNSCPVSLTDMAAGLECDSLPEGAVAITLDDGSFDNLHTASRILQEFELPATFFIPTERLAEPREYWWDTLERIFSSPVLVTEPLDLSAETGEVFNIRTASDRSTVHHVIAGGLRTLDWRERDRVMARVTSWSAADVTPRDSHRPMLVDEIREIARRPGHAIGAHTVHHLGLPSLPLDRRLDEMLDSQRGLEDLLGMPVRSFAYPYGRCDADTIGTARELFDVAVTTQSAFVTRADDRLALPRFDGNQLSTADLLRLSEGITSSPSA